MKKHKYKLLSINDFKKIAINRKGKCLSKKYIPGQKLKFQCQQDHIWKADGNLVKFKSWCPKCSNNIKYTKKEVNNYVFKKFRGKLLSNYKNNGTKEKWQCKNNHTWLARFRDIKHGHWCPFCSNQFKKSIKYCNDIAKSRGGNCVSKIYKNNKSKLKWKCENGHTWKARVDNVINNGRWCPQCAADKHYGASRAEILCRKTFEETFKKPFSKIRPHWLIGPKNFPLELDGYCSEFNIAFEYNGLQHKQEVKFFKIDKDKLKYGKKKCKELGITLIIIDYIRNPTKEKFKKIIYENLGKQLGNIIK